MAKRAINKSAKIRELARKGMEAKEVFAEFKKLGITVSNPSVYTNIAKVKEEMASGAKNGGAAANSPATKVAKSRTTRVAKAKPSTNGAGFTADDISTLATLAEKAGGLSRLGEWVTALSKIK